MADGKPWTLLYYEYIPEAQQRISETVMLKLGQQAIAHSLWRQAYFKGSGEPPSHNALLIRAAGLSEARKKNEGLPLTDDGDKQDKQDKQKRRNPSKRVQKGREKKNSSMI